MRYPERRLVPWLVAAALLVNGAAYWWFSGQRDLRLAVPVRVAEPGPPVPTLTLLREREVLDVTSEAPVEAVAETRAEDASEALAVGPPAPSDTPADTTSAPSAPSDALQDLLMGPPEPQPAASAAPEAVVPAIPAPKRLQCLLLGPGTSAAEVNRWGAAIAGAGVTQADVRMLDQETVTGYRVMAPARSRPEVTLAKLAAAGFDGFVIDKDGRGAQISLGLFQVRANAQRLLAQLREHGYAATILPDREVRRMPWLEMHVSAKGLRGAKAVLAAKFPDASPVWRDCPVGTASQH